MGRGIAVAALIAAVLGCGEPRIRRLRPPAAGPVLVVAPHPDDETIAAGGLIADLTRHGVPVQIVFVTDGDGWAWAVTSALGRGRPRPADYRRLGELRRAEAIRAAGALGVPEAAIEFLGFPDGGLAALPEDAGPRSHPFRSPFTGRTRSPDAEGGAIYTRSTLLGELTSIVQAVNPTLVVLPHPDDVHADHATVACLVVHAVDVATPPGADEPRLLAYLVHDPAWPPAAVDPPQPMPVPGGERVRGEWVSYDLSAADLAAKTAALRAHASQLAASGEFLQRFLRSSEIFVRDPAGWCAPLRRSEPDRR